jgi:hypothetical protein
LGGFGTLCPDSEIIVVVELVVYRSGGEGMILNGMGEGSAGDGEKFIHLVGAVAVVVIAVLFDKCTIFADGQQSADIVIGIGELAAYPLGIIRVRVKLNFHLFLL